jgi:hypothetical protein
LEKYQSQQPKHGKPRVPVAGPSGTQSTRPNDPETVRRPRDLETVRRPRDLETVRPKDPRLDRTLRFGSAVAQASEETSRPSDPRIFRSEVPELSIQSQLASLAEDDVNLDDSDDCKMFIDA